MFHLYEAITSFPGMVSRILEVKFRCAMLKQVIFLSIFNMLRLAMSLKVSATRGVFLFSFGHKCCESIVNKGKKRRKQIFTSNFPGQISYYQDSSCKSKAHAYELFISFLAGFFEYTPWVYDVWFCDMTLYSFIAAGLWLQRATNNTGGTCSSS